MSLSSSGTFIAPCSAAAAAVVIFCVGFLPRGTRGLLLLLLLRAERRATTAPRAARAEATAAVVVMYVIPGTQGGAAWE
jgi:hypothetical protein